MNKVLITGGAGYIGSVLVGDLLKENFKVRVLDRFMFGGESLLSLVHDPKLEVFQGDIRDKNMLKKCLQGVDSVIHLAALVGEPACEKNPKVTREINVKASKQLAQLAKTLGVTKFIFASTASNYGISPDEEASESSPLDPQTLYAKTKIAAENYLLKLEDEHFHPVILRKAMIFGLSPKIRFNLLVNEFARDAYGGKNILVVNERAWKPFLHVRDACRAYKTILLAPLSKISGEVFNVAGENVQKRDLARLAKKVNPQIKIEVKNTGKFAKTDYRVSSNKIKMRLQWEPEITVEKGFIEIADALKKKIFLDPYEFRFNAWFDNRVFNE